MIAQNKQEGLKYSKSLSQLTRYAFLYLHAQTSIDTLLFDPIKNHEKIEKKINLDFL